MQVLEKTPLNAPDSRNRPSPARGELAAVAVAVVLGLTGLGMGVYAIVTMPASASGPTGAVGPKGATGPQGAPGAVGPVWPGGARRTAWAPRERPVPRAPSVRVGW